MSTPSPDAPSHQEQIEKLADLREANPFCMLTTIDDGGKPWSRPMIVQNARFDGTLWFFTRDDAAKVAHVRRNLRTSASPLPNRATRTT